MRRIPSDEQVEVFICHASEDKKSVVEPLTKALRDAGVTYWVDSENIQWGDSLSEAISDGIRRSRFGIIVLSQAFLKKRWPEKELYAILSLETTSGKKKALPLLVGTKIERQEILSAYPLLIDKRYLTWEGDASPIIESYSTLRGDAVPMPEPNPGKSASQPRISGIPLYKPRKDFTDLDKSNFLREAFRSIEGFFESGLQQMEASDPRIATEFIRVSELKFTAAFFVDGGLINRCVLWLGSTFRESQISYREGRSLDYQGDGSMNDWVHVESDEHAMYLRMGLGLHIDQRLTSREASEYLWKRFIAK